jgi:hypothetical protein
VPSSSRHYPTTGVGTSNSRSTNLPSKEGHIQTLIAFDCPGTLQKIR